MSKINVSKPTLDLVIDETTSYFHRLELNMDLTINTGATAGITSDSDIVIDYSKFNEPVNITAPAGATPTDSILSVFS